MQQLKFTDIWEKGPDGLSRLHVADVSGGYKIYLVHNPKGALEDYAGDAGDGDTVMPFYTWRKDDGEEQLAFFSLRIALTAIVRDAS